MVGRAGRFGFDLKADSYLCIPKSRAFYEKQTCIDLLSKERLERIDSCLGMNDKGLSRIILDSIGTGLVKN